MDAEDESTAYLRYLNDPTAPNGYLLSNGVELTDTFPFAEIEATDWPSEGFPILLSSPLIKEVECNVDVPSAENIGLVSVEESTVNDDSSKGVEFIETPEVDLCSENSFSTYLSIEEDINNARQKSNKKTYINYAPIVKENPDGNKEIYLTENDINNDASIIQLFNTDGSVITIDKSILSSLNLPKTEALKVPKKKLEDFYCTVTANKCKVCNFLCETELEIKNHLNESHANLFVETVTKKQNGGISVLKSNNREYTIFLCSICKIAYSNKEELKEHMMKNHSLELNNEQKLNEEKTIEGEKIEEKKSLKASWKILIKLQEKAKKKVKCTVKGCHLRFPKDDIRLKHEACHVENKKQFKCTECDEKFALWRICSSHMWKIHKIDLGLLMCPMCNSFKANSSIRVLNHMAIHNDEKPFLCSDCGKGFKTMVQLKNHEVIHKKLEELPNWSLMRQCEICERYFANSKCLKKHVQSVHENFKPFICNICGHKTTRKAMLELHLRQHTGVKPHACPYCDYRTGDHNCLRKHIMRHNGAKKYLCPHCPYTSIQSASYKNHISNHHPGKSGTYSCSYCSFTCINSVNYFAHIKTHEAALKENGKAANNTNELAENQSSNAQSKPAEAEDDETQNFFTTDHATVEETIDTGGITIPAGLEMQLVS